MAHDNLTDLPSQIIRGTSVFYTQNLGEFPASDGWTMKLHIAGASVLTITGVQNGDGFDVELTPTNTLTLAIGPHLFEERYTKSATHIHRGCYGSIEVLPDLESATAGLVQSFESKMLAAVEAALTLRMGIGGVSKDLIDSYSIGSRSFTKTPTEKLMGLRARLKRQVDQQAHPGRLGPKFQVEFGRAD